MKTWLDADLWALPVAVLMILVFPMLLPTLQIQGNYIGGGVIREWVLNHVLMPFVPLEKGQAVVDWWHQAGWFEESMVYAIFVVNAFALLMPVIYALMKLKIASSNWYRLRQFKDKHHYVKGK